MAPLRETAAGLYVHVPFCRSKCPYCHFYSTTSLDLIPEWLEAVKKEALFYQGLFSSFDTVYFGGGTPSLLSPAALGGLVECFQNRFGLSEDCEITLEANPGDLDTKTAREIRKTGINRLSLGVQSFSEEDLMFLGRRHRVPEAVQAIEAGRAAGFENLGIDLIFGLPGQTGVRWQKGLAFALSFEPEHLSAYQLTPEEGTPLGKDVARGRVRMWGKRNRSDRSWKPPESWRVGGTSTMKCQISPGVKDGSPGTTGSTGNRSLIWVWDLPPILFRTAGGGGTRLPWRSTWTGSGGDKGRLPMRSFYPSINSGWNR